MDRFKNLKVIGFAAVSVFGLLLAPGISHYIRNHELTVVSLSEKNKEIDTLKANIALREAQNTQLTQQNLMVQQRLQIVKAANQQLMRNHIRDLAIQHAQAQVPKMPSTTALSTTVISKHQQSDASSTISSHTALGATAHRLARLHNVLSILKVPAHDVPMDTTAVTHSIGTKVMTQYAAPKVDKSAKHLAMLQVGVFTSVERAQRLKNQLIEHGFNAHVRPMISPNKPLRTKVVVQTDTATMEVVKQGLLAYFHIDAVVLNDR